jgi:hypothetical protein
MVLGVGLLKEGPILAACRDGVVYHGGRFECMIWGWCLDIRYASP